MQDKDILVSLSQVRAALAVAQVTGPGNVPAGTWSVLTGAVLDDLRDQFAGMVGMQRVRPSLVAFVLLMEDKLRKHDMDTLAPKPWDTQTMASVTAHLESELAELAEAGTTQDWCLEAADVANCLHVLVDKLTGCQYGPRGQGK